MGNKFYFVKETNFLSYTPVVSPAADPTYDATNLYNYNSITMRYQSATGPGTEHTIVIDTGSTNTIIGVMLDYVNFTSALIQGNDTDSWGSPTYDSTNVISLDRRINRYKIYKDVSWSCRYVRVKIPVQSVTDGTNFRVGRIIIAGSKTEPNQNPFYPYEYSATKTYKVIELESGSEEVVKLGSHKIWSCEFGIDYLKSAYEWEWWDLDNNDEDKLMLLYENCSDTSKCYVCRKKGSIKISEKSYGVVGLTNFILKEKV